MKLHLDGLYLITGSHNQIINNQVGKVYYSKEMKRFVFKPLNHEDPEAIDDYVVNPDNLFKVTVAEHKLMQENRIYINRPDGI